MAYKQGRYSKFIKPLFLIIDLTIINLTVLFFDTNITNTNFFIAYISILWLLISIKNQFYEVQRHSRVIQIVTLLFRQIILFALILYAFIGIFKQPNISRLSLGYYLLSVFVLITFRGKFKTCCCYWKK